METTWMPAMRGLNDPLYIETRLSFIKMSRISCSIDNKVIKLSVWCPYIMCTEISAMKLGLQGMFVFISHFHNRLINEHVLLVQGEKTFFHLGGKGSMIDVTTRRKKSTGTHETKKSK